MKIRVSASKRYERQCAYCHEDVGLDDRDVDSCPECDTHLHEACWKEVPDCPTVGCGWKPAVEGPEPRRVTLRRTPRRPRVRCYRCSERLDEQFTTCMGCGWSFHHHCYDGRQCCQVARDHRPRCGRCGGQFLDRRRHTCQRCGSVLHTGCSAYHRCEEETQDWKTRHSARVLGWGVAFAFLIFIIVMLALRK